MNKIISITTYACAILASGYLAVSARSSSPMTSPAAKQTEVKLVNNNLILRDSNGAILNSSENKERENLGKTLIILGLITGTGFFGWYLSRSRSSTASIAGKNSSTALLNQVSPRLKRKLLRLVNDPQTANRLLAGIHKHNRDRSPNWLAEKAIYDLRRGR